MSDFFCYNPSCDRHKKVDDDIIEEGDMMGMKGGEYYLYRRTEYVDYKKDRGYKTIYFCNICMEVVETIKRLQDE
jgi:hypothetical protein